MLDIDPKNGGDESLAKLEGTHGKLPVTLQVRTGGGGRHLYFNTTAGKQINCSASKLGPGLDVRGDGGYVVAPPSKHSSGETYNWVDEAVPVVRLEDTWLETLLLARQPHDVHQRAPERFLEGTRNTNLFREARCLRDRAWTEEEIRDALLVLNAKRCEPPLLDDEVAGIARSAAKREARVAAPTEPKIVCMEDVKEEAVDWLWRGYIPRDALTVIEGDPGLGKSTLTLEIAARLSRGEALPGGVAAAPMAVLVLSGEDAPGSVIRPRLRVAGADMQRVFIADESEATFDLSRHIAFLERVCEERQVAAVIIDPLNSYIGRGVDTHKDQDVRQVLTQVARLAQERHLSILLVRHLNKRQGGPAIQRGGGSIGIVAAARSCLLLAKHPDDAKQRVMASVKLNLGPAPKSLLFCFDETSPARIKWLGEADYSADDLVQMAMAPAESKLQAAESLLRRSLSSGPRPAREVYAEARSECIAEKTLERAKIDLRVHSRPDGFQGPQLWELPGDDPCCMTTSGLDDTGFAIPPMTTSAISSEEARLEPSGASRAGGGVAGDDDPKDEIRSATGDEEEPF